MEKLKEFMRSPKKTAILGFVSSILMILNVFLNNNHSLLSLLFQFSSKLFIFGFALYFLIILLRLVKNIGNIKIANYFLIISFIIPILIEVFIIIKYQINIKGVIYLIVYIYLSYYLYNLLIKRNYKVNNIIFSAVLIGFVVYQMIYSIYCKNFIISAYNNFTQNLIMNIMYLIMKVSYVGIIPYFINYSKLLRERGK